jgi:hypothetical protein
MPVGRQAYEVAKLKEEFDVFIYSLLSLWYNVDKIN